MTSFPPRAALLFVGSALLLAGCSSGDAPGGAEPVVRDSAGVVIVEHPETWPEGPVWTVDIDEAVYLEGDLHQVRGGVVLADGTIVVGEASSRRLRFHDAQGALIRTVGRDGEGPGEFRSLGLVAAWPGDSIAVWDMQLRRISVFAGDGTLGHSFSLRTSDEVPFANVRGIHADGSMFATGFARMGDGPPQGRAWTPSPTYRFERDGSLVGALPAEQASEGYYEHLNGGFRVWSALFPLGVHVAAGPEVLVEAPNRSWEIRVRRPSGDLARIVRRSGAPERITEAMHRAAAEAQMALSTQADEEHRRRLMGMPVPERVPAYGMVIVDRLDRIWVADYEWAPDGPEAHWTVLDAEGGFVARARLPARLIPHEIGDGRILGVLRDEFDVEHAVLMPLRPL